MNTKNDVEVVISGRKYKLCGYESDAYLQSVATYLNQKYDSFRDMENYHRMDSDLRNVLLEINIADDYFKAKTQAERLEEEVKKKNNELFDIKHDMINMQSKVDTVMRDMQALKFENIEAQKKIVKLETELEERSRREKERLRERHAENAIARRITEDGEPVRTDLAAVVREQAEKRPATLHLRENEEEPELAGSNRAPEQPEPEPARKNNPEDPVMINRPSPEKPPSRQQDMPAEMSQTEPDENPAREQKAQCPWPGKAQAEPEGEGFEEGETAASREDAEPVPQKREMGPSGTEVPVLAEEKHRFVFGRHSRRPRRAYIDGWKPEWKL